MAIKIEMNDHGFHRLVDDSAGETTRWASYTSFTYLNGMVGTTDYFTETGEKVMTADAFCKLAGVGKEM